MRLPARLTVEWDRQAQRDLNRLDRAARARIAAALGRLVETGRGDIVKLTGWRALYRLRVGDWRVVFRRRDDVATIQIVSVLHRRDVCRR